MGGPLGFSPTPGRWLKAKVLPRDCIPCLGTGLCSFLPRSLGLGENLLEGEPLCLG